MQNMYAHRRVSSLLPAANVSCCLRARLALTTTIKTNEINPQRLLYAFGSPATSVKSILSVIVWREIARFRLGTTKLQSSAECDSSTDNDVSPSAALVRTDHKTNEQWYPCFEHTRLPPCYKASPQGSALKRRDSIETAVLFYDRDLGLNKVDR